VFFYVEATERYVTRLEKQLGSACYLLDAAFVLGLYFYPEGESDVFLRNVC
jgi:hypothetical protein